MGKYSEELAGEAEAFDEHARSRYEHGLIPDLRRAGDVDYFYNNPWRRKYLVERFLGRYFQFARTHAKGRRLLEVGSGTGFMSLEFAREGFEVTGLELSKKAVEIAEKTAAENPFTEGFGSLEYVCDDFFHWEAEASFDTLCLFGTLHHFEDPGRVLERAEKLLAEQGRIIVIEPARDWMNTNDGAWIALIRLLLSAYGGWYEELELPQNEDELDTLARDTLVEFQEARDKGEGLQSPHDNDADAEVMLSALRERFAEEVTEPGFAFLHRVGGGVRSESEEKTRALVEFLDCFDRYAVKSGMMNAGGFLFAGTKQ